MHTDKGLNVLKSMLLILLRLMMLWGFFSLKVCDDVEEGEGEGKVSSDD